MSRTTIAVLAALIVCCCLEAASGSPLQFHGLCNTLCGQNKGIGIVKDGICVCNLAEFLLKRNSETLEEVKKKALEAGLTMNYTSPLEHLLKKGRPPKIPLLVKHPEEILEEVQENLEKILS